mgnify:CR=1 FL=1
MIEITHFQSPIGRLTLIGLNQCVVRICFGYESVEKLEALYMYQLKIKSISGRNTNQYAEEQILSYLNGKCQYLDFPVLHFNTPFRKRVLETEREIPYGKTRSYGEVAKMIGHPNASRAVGSANSENPLPLYYPCHRIIHSNGNMGRYGGGMKVKKFLLDLEQSL